MSDLLAGLAGLGLGDLESIDIFADPEKEKEKKKKEMEEQGKVAAVLEKDLIYDKTIICPVCDEKFTSKITKTGKARLLGMDKDLRPIHEGIDTQKYDVILCPHCGYAALTRFFPNITSGQAKLIRESISKKVHLHEYKDEIYSYEQALERYKLALVGAVVKRGKNSEKAYICLKSAWLIRGYIESLEKVEETPREQLEQLHALEETNLQNAYKGFIEARQSEPFPMCGMDEMTVDYLLAALGVRFKDYETASKLVAQILSTSGANARTKDKARELKDEIILALKNNKR